MRTSLRFPILLKLLLSVHFLTAQTPDRTIDLVAERTRPANPQRQEELRDMKAWREFRQQHPGWSVEFNEASGKPHRAFGRPIATSGATPEDRAMNFIHTQLAPFGIPVNELIHLATTGTAKHSFVRYAQRHGGLPVINGYLLVKLDQQGRVISFGTEVHDDIQLELEPIVSPAQAAGLASDGLSNVGAVEFEGLKILPIPAAEGTDHRLVHELLVNATNNGRPANYLCWVDAHTGVIWYRRDQVMECGHSFHDGGGDAGADVQVNATVHVASPTGPTEVVGLPDLRVSINGGFYYTDADGFLPTGITGPVSAQIPMRGRWSNVMTNSQTPSTTTTLNEGGNLVDMDPVATIRQRSAYHFVNQIHKQVNDVLPNFTGMDFTLPTNVDLQGGDCNAYYDGASINFYAQANGCHSMAYISDVVYHEYGHGINDKYYQSQGGMFVNRAMNEGYADVWSLSLSRNPILALGYRLNEPGSFIRRYDQAPKVYPIDLVGQEHADGEIICGAWWDTYLLLNEDMDLLMELFAGAFPGLQATAFNGQEGTAFRDVLIDLLEADDDDADITNGTPNGMAIINGFALHGITLISNVQLQHQPMAVAPADEVIHLQANVPVSFPYNTYLSGVRTFYKVNAGTEWESVLMTNTSGSTYAASLPQQPAGSVIAYYVSLEDIFGNVSSVTPRGAAMADANLPYYIVVGAEVVATENGDDVHQLGFWQAGLPGDNATTGHWVWSVPIGSFADPADPSTMVQPDHQHTTGGEFCWVTGNASSPSSPLGENDVDDGTTTIMSSIIDLSAYQEPIFSYWRWYVNNPPSGANPNADWWQVYISNDDGASWVPVEETKTSDRSWRRKVFRVRDHLEPTSTIRIKFHASDSIRPGEYLDGGSLVEAAIDDIELWELEGSGIGIREHVSMINALYPDPASDVINVLLAEQEVKGLRFEVLDISGRIAMRPAITPQKQHTLDVRSLAEGQYVLRAIWDNGHSERRFSVIR